VQGREEATMVCVATCVWRSAVYALSLAFRLEQIDKATAEYLKEKVFVPATS
jgi:hypothetical protein